MSLSRSVVLLVLGVAVWACGDSAPRPPFEAPSTHGVVRAHDEDTARRLAARLDTLYPQVRRELIEATHTEVDVRVIPPPELGHDGRSVHLIAGTATSDGTIVLNVRVNGREATLVHELVHVLADDAWSALPSVAFEGLADTIGERLLPNNPASNGRLPRFFTFAPDESLLFLETANGSDGLLFASNAEREVSPDLEALLAPRIDLAEALRSGSLEGTLVYAVGAFVVTRIVDRIGLDGLHRRCVEAHESDAGVLSPAELLALAELDADVATWWPLVLERLEPRHLAAFVSDNADGLVRGLGARYGDALREGDALEFLRARRVRLATRAGEAEVELATIPALAERLASQGEPP